MIVPEPRKRGLLASRQGPREQQPHHAVGIHPAEVTRVDEHPLAGTADDLVEEGVDRAVIERTGNRDDVQGATSCRRA